MSVHRCPDCAGARTMGRPCMTCEGSRYVNRNSQGRITHPATSEQYLRYLSLGKRPGPRPSPQGYR